MNSPLFLEQQALNTFHNSHTNQAEPNRSSDVHQNITSTTHEEYGFTLIELLCALSIVVILSAVALPSLQDIYLRSEANASINRVSGLIRLARSSAITQSVTTTLCPSQDGQTCAENWEDGTLLFIDINKNKQLDDEDQIIQYQSPFLSNGSLQWLSFRNAIQFTSRGYPNGTIGSFIYCPDNMDETYGKSAILNFQGKLRQGKDSNGDGIIESGNKHNISCS
mgnify:CR=1 FL=1